MANERVCRACAFETSRLSIGSWHRPELLTAGQTLEQLLLALLTPEVTQGLPPSWQRDLQGGAAHAWIEARDAEGTMLLVRERASHTAVGFLTLFEDPPEGEAAEVRLGYVFGEASWGQGFATELVQGLIQWCRAAPVSSLVGGVEVSNMASRRVLEKCGFQLSPGDTGPPGVEFYRLEQKP